MRYINFLMISILVLDKLRKDGFIEVINQRGLTRSIKKYFQDNSEYIRGLR